jgi:peptidoglycan/LPS O-acetylase OafA/YrhL
MAASPPAPAHTPHIARLDVLRALAFLGVFAFHMTGPYLFLKITWNGNWADFSQWPPVLYWLLPVGFGWLGVPLFFVLSGFCIHYSTLKRKAPFVTGDFYWRRFLRIYPAYIVCVIGCALLAPWLPEKYSDGAGQVAWQLVTHVLMVHNFTKMTFAGLNGALWSLAVEVQFYLLYPLLLLVMRRRWRMSWAQCLAVALVLNVVLYVYFSLTSKPYEMTHTRPTFSFPLVTWCTWILGAALAESYVEGKPLFTRPNAWLIGSALMLLAALVFRPLYVQGYLFSSVFFAVVLQRYLVVHAPLWTLERALAPVGLISYSLYLWHGPALQLVELWGSAWHLYSTPLQEAVYIALAGSALLFPFAWLSYRLCEVAAPKWIAALASRRNASASPGVTVS